MSIPTFVWYLIALFVISLFILPKEMKKSKQEFQNLMDYYTGEREDLLKRNFPESAWFYTVNDKESEKPNLYNYKFTLEREFERCKVSLYHGMSSYRESRNGSRTSDDSYTVYSSYFRMKITPTGSNEFRLSGKFKIDGGGLLPVFKSIEESSDSTELSRTSDTVKFGKGLRFKYSGMDWEDIPSFMRNEPLKTAEELLDELSMFKNKCIKYKPKKNLIVLEFEDDNKYTDYKEYADPSNDLIINNASALKKSQELMNMLAEVVTML